MAITSPAPNAQVKSSVTIKATAKDDLGVTNVELRVNSVLMASKSSAPFEFPTVLQAGVNTVTVVAYDLAKNKGQASVSLTVGGAPRPAPRLDSGGAPAPGADGGLVPPQTGGNGTFGNRCKIAAECLTGLCAYDPALNEKYCAQECGVQDWCPPGGLCVQASGSAGKICALQLNNPRSTQDVAGCSLGISAASAGSLGLLLLGLVALGLRRRQS